ncbi:hypothetical protein RI367_003475 [Sorochytrium milnesiophthora]
MELSKQRGDLCLIGDKIREWGGHKQARVVLLTAAEQQQRADTARALPSTRDVYNLGIAKGQTTGDSFVQVLWTAGSVYRKQLGLPVRQFYITLSDALPVDQALVPQSDELPDALDVLDHLSYAHYLAGDFDKARVAAAAAIERYASSPKGYLRLGEAACKTSAYKLALLAYAQVLERSIDVKLQTFAVKQLFRCAQHTEWGPLFAVDDTLEGGSVVSHEYQQLALLPHSVRDIILSAWSASVRDQIAENSTCMPDNSAVWTMDPRQRLATHTLYRLPRFFRWVVPFKLAAMSTPRSEQDVRTLADPHLGIRHIVTLTKETPLSPDWFDNKTTIRNTFLPVDNYRAPTVEQVDVFLRLVQQEAPVLVHCGGGKGRAGTFLACYVALFGTAAMGDADLDKAKPIMSAQEAVRRVRHVRPGSIETDEQELFVQRYVGYAWKRAHASVPQVVEPNDGAALAIAGDQDIAKADFVVLVALPGAGKSTFAARVCMRDPSWTVVSQDESGSRAACERQVGRHSKLGSGRMLLDRCNPTAQDRAAWLALASARHPICIFFDYDRALCEHRANRRTNHPTLTPGRVRNAIQQMHDSLEQPQLREGFKSVVTVRSIGASNACTLLLVPTVPLFKYPRTHHLYNLGAATRDDITYAGADLDNLVQRAPHVVIEEKVDGANLGFSLDRHRALMVQNRSHYVNSATHAQFRQLDRWVAERREALYTVLDRDEDFPERYVLFGEWMAATHSIHYTHLPSLFIAFDLYDRVAARFVSRPILRARLADTGLSMPPTLLEGPMPPLADLLALTARSSSFTHGTLEGVYIRFEHPGDAWCSGRGKIVRQDFIAGNEHWTKGPPQRNVVVAIESNT